MILERLEATTGAGLQEKNFLRNFVKFTGKRLCRSLFLNKVTGLRHSTLLKKKLHRCFPVNFAKFLRTLLKNRLQVAASKRKRHSRKNR